MAKDVSLYTLLGILRNIQKRLDHIEAYYAYQHYSLSKLGFKLSRVDRKKLKNYANGITEVERIYPPFIQK